MPSRQAPPSAFGNFKTDKPLPPTQPSEDFKPVLPKDPFSQRLQPWQLDIDEVIQLQRKLSTNRVFLVIGEPKLKELGPLLNSSFLSQCLLIFASHKLISLPPSTMVAAHTRFMPLREPLSLEAGGAIRFVELLREATQIAYAWRSGSALSKFSVPSVKASHRLSKTRSQMSEPSLPMDIPSPSYGGRTKPLDGIFNFMSNDLQDKALLKQAILVMTISKPFLVSRDNDKGKTITGSEAKRWSSLLSRPKGHIAGLKTYSLQDIHSMSSSESALLVHVLPQSHDFHSPLTTSLENFFLAFSSPSATASISLMGAHSQSTTFLLHPSTMGKSLRAPISTQYPALRRKQYTVTDLLIIGALSCGPERAHISDASDIMFNGAESEAWSMPISRTDSGVPSLLAGESSDEDSNGHTLHTPSPSSVAHVSLKDEHDWIPSEARATHVYENRLLRPDVPPQVPSKAHLSPKLDRRSRPASYNDRMHSSSPSHSRPGSSSSRAKRPTLQTIESGLAVPRIRTRRISSPSPAPAPTQPTKSSRWSFLPWKNANGSSVSVR